MKLLNVLKTLAVFVLIGAIYMFFSIRAYDNTYAKEVAPDGIETYAQWEARFGKPAFQRSLPGGFYKIYGTLDPTKALLFLLSGPPAYIFNEHGNLVDWCVDSGEANQFHARWSPATEIDHATLTNALQKAPL